MELIQLLFYFQGLGTGILSQDWTGRAGIGQHQGERVLNGEIDEFYMFSKALPVQKIQTLMKKCSFEIGKHSCITRWF